MRFLNSKILSSLLLITALSAFTACGPSYSDPSSSTPPFSKAMQTDDVHYAPVDDLTTLLDSAEATASPEGKTILKNARAMVDSQEIILGSCWDYIDSLFNRSKFEDDRRATLFSSKKAGPFADVNTIRAGDWLYLINHSYGDVEHSGVFIAWIDQSKFEALLLSYPGEDRHVPGRYSEYDLTSVYNIIRAKPASALE
jgi:hypothetical protein